MSAYLLSMNISHFMQLPEVIDESLQNATMMDHSRIYESGLAIDEHRDMRLDVDNMTYEACISFECL